MTMSLPEHLLQQVGQAVRVAYQGNPGAFSEIAAINTVQGAAAHGYATFHEVIAAVSSGQAELGVLPVENSLMGSILQAIDLLVDTDLHVIGEVVVRVSHALMALPGVQLPDIKRVYSQQPALDQCPTFLNKHHLTPVAAHDTAGSAKDLAERGARDEGVIASARAAELYGLEVLQNHIEDEAFNFTRFLVLSHREGLPTSGPYKTSVIFAVRHSPGSLLDTLNQLSGLNMVSIVSRPRKDRAWSYLIHVDFEGNADDPEISSALGAVLRKASYAKIIGSYPMAQAPIEP
ncbi:prephenate dehydratase [Deinococcus sp.]|uniref:prephenate dehydratase n=1 Tax=Deinococcus sp. TaxID=47478 RepID=UPI003B58D86C